MEPSPKSPENTLLALKDDLRAYFTSSYSLDSGERHAVQIDDLDTVRKKHLAAIETVDVDALEELANNIERWFVYINEKDRAEGARAMELHKKVLGWIDDILAR